MATSAFGQSSLPIGVLQLPYLVVDGHEGLVTLVQGQLRVKADGPICWNNKALLH